MYNVNQCNHLRPDRPPAVAASKVSFTLLICFFLSVQVQYSIVEQSPSPAFQLDSGTGALTLQSQLDYEVQPEYTLVVKATDQAKDSEKRLFTLVTCKVIVEDENDNIPIFKSKGTVRRH